MNADGLTTVIMHQDTKWRERLAAALGQRGIRCVSVHGSSNATDAETVRQATVALVQIPGLCGDLVEPAIAEAHERFAGCALIAVTRPDDVLGTRAAFRAGAWDCLDETTDVSALADCVTDALQNRTSGERTSGPCRPVLRRDGAALPQHSAFLDALGGLRSLCRRQGRGLSIMMLDLDRFRLCNERHSPAFGDQVLSWFGALLCRVCRRSDVVARYQGDRFIIALPDARGWQAAELAQRCHKAMRDNAVEIEGHALEMTAGIGIAESTAGFIETEHQLIQRARLALTQAKQQGGDTTVTWSEVLSTPPARRTRIR